jgi:hypothetical protein
VCVVVLCGGGLAGLSCFAGRWEGCLEFIYLYIYDGVCVCVCVCMYLYLHAEPGGGGVWVGQIDLGYELFLPFAETPPPRFSAPQKSRSEL